MSLHLVESAVGVVEITLLSWLIASEGVPTPGVATAWAICTIILVILVAKQWPLGPIMALVISSAMPRVSSIVLNLHLRPEHIVIAVVFLGTLTRKHRQDCYGKLSWNLFDYALLAYVGVSFLASAATSPSPAVTLRSAAMNAISIGAYFLIRVLLREQSSLEQGFQCLLWVSAAESAAGIVCFLCNRAFGTEFGVAAEQYGFVAGIHGTQFEANLFGAYTACGAILFLVMYLQGERTARIRHLVGLTITAAGTLVSLSRAAIVALLCVTGFVLWFTLRRRQLNMRRVLAVTTAAGILFVVASPLFLRVLEERFANIDLSELSSDDTTESRLVQLAAACDEILAHPILGTGSNSFQLTFQWGDYIPGGLGPDEDTPGWIANTLIRVVHDTGAVGLLFFMTFVSLLVLATRRILKVTSGSPRTIVFALSSALIVYAITFQTTEATILAFPWVHVGMLAAAVTSTSASSFSYSY